MARIIPSKNIYGTPSNNKVIKNKIDNVSVSQTVVTPNNEYGVTVFNERKSDLSTIQSVSSDQNYKTMGSSQTGGGVTAITGAMWYAKADQKYMYKNTIYIPILQKNKYVSNLSLGVNNKDGENNIKVNIYGTLSKGIATANWGAEYNQNAEGNFIVNIGEISYTKTEESDQNISIPKNIDKTYSAGMYELKAYLDISNMGNLATATAEKVTISGIDYFKIYIETLCSVRTVSMGGTFVQYYGHFSLSGEYETYTPKYIEITFYGDTIGINLEDGSYDYTIGYNNPYSLTGNELLQNTTTTLDENDYRSPTAYHLARSVYFEYQNGKETAVVRCSIPEDLSVFEIGDEVIPMVFGADGVDRPMSRYKDGTQKVFNVVDTKSIYDGAVWQELTLQEKTQSV